MADSLAEPIGQPTEVIRYPEWQPECRAVMLEIDPEKVREKVAIAELAIQKRALELNGPDDDAERRAMKREAERMRLALAEIMQQHPDLKK